MTVNSQEYRDALSKFASGVTVVTVAVDGRPHGMTASAFASVSLDPPLVLVCLEKASRTRALVVQTGLFAVNVLAEDQEGIAKSFSLPGPKPFDALSHHAGVNGPPLLDGAIAWVECTLEQVIKGGDHDVAIGEVNSCEMRDGEPLLYFNRGYRALG